jgi:hypothetical protein
LNSFFDALFFDIFNIHFFSFNILLDMQESSKQQLTIYK